jgi:hypothetical protein
MKTPHSPRSFWAPQSNPYNDEDYGRCPICGAIFGIAIHEPVEGPKDASSQGAWLRDVVLLDLDKFNDTSDEYASGELSLKSTRAFGGGCFQDVTSHYDTTKTCKWNDKLTTWDYDNYPHYVAFRPVCCGLARRAVEHLDRFPKWLGSGPTMRRADVWLRRSVLVLSLLLILKQTQATQL